MSKEEFDRLMETSPSIDKKIIEKFNKTFSGGPIKKGKPLTQKQITFSELHKPEICDVLESTKHYIYKETPEDIAKKKTLNLVDYVKQNNEFKKKSIVVSNFIDKFNVEYKREPTHDEIHDNLGDNIESNTITNIIIEKDRINNI